MGIISASGKCKASPALTSSRILSEEGLKAWWIGKVSVEEVDPLWPATGSKMRWKAGGGLFKANITKDARPEFIEMLVETPSADSIIRHTFEALPNGGTLYTKSVEPKWRSGFSRIIGLLFLPILRPMVKREVKKAVLYADA
jgi:hypothetical protein